MKREYAGIPLWGWLATAAAVAGVAFYIYRRNAAQATASGTGSAGGVAADGAPYQSGVSSLYGWLLDHQGSPTTTTTTTCPPGYVWSKKKHRCYKPAA